MTDELPRMTRFDDIPFDRAALEDKAMFVHRAQVNTEKVMARLHSSFWAGAQATRLLCMNEALAVGDRPAALVHELKAREYAARVIGS